MRTSRRSILALGLSAGAVLIAGCEEAPKAPLTATEPGTEKAVLIAAGMT